ncbi:MAG: HAMP domain-containing sensor histidine kinase [Pirellulaceae bacterium]|nr:HAMP domain-containing sensor histidine kinase [Pirellulaceae bacterium]
MLLNAFVVLVASMGTLIGLRAGMRIALVNELDQILSEDLKEIELAMLAAGDPGSSALFEELDRKAQGHVQHRWFAQIRNIDLGSKSLPPKLVTSHPESNFVDHVWQNVNVPEELEFEASEATTPVTLAGYRLLDRIVKLRGLSQVRIRVGASMNLIDRDLTLIDRIIGITFGVGLIIAPLGGYWLAGKATRPLATIIDTADRLRPEELSERLPIRGTGDELDHLSLTFNLLLDRIAKFLQQRRDFLANAAHELRTPLAALRSTAEVALRSQRSLSEYHDLLGTIVEESESLEILVNQLLLLAETEAYAQTQLLNPEPVELEELVEKACDMFGGVAESRDIRLSYKVIASATVKGNRQHLRQVMNNLIDNAIKFTPPGGSVTVKLTSNLVTNQACVSIEDTGIGIADDEKPRLFDRFYRGDRSRRRDSTTRGTGLGLSICQAIVIGHGGALDVSSQIGKGSRFLVSLPIYLAAES